jgi:hypothetical protein
LSRTTQVCVIGANAGGGRERHPSNTSVVRLKCCNRRHCYLDSSLATRLRRQFIKPHTEEGGVAHSLRRHTLVTSPPQRPEEASGRLTKGQAESAAVPMAPTAAAAKLRLCITKGQQIENSVAAGSYPRRKIWRGESRTTPKPRPTHAAKHRRWLAGGPAIPQGDSSELETCRALVPSFNELQHGAPGGGLQCALARPALWVRTADMPRTRGRASAPVLSGADSAAGRIPPQHVRRDIQRDQTAVRMLITHMESLPSPYYPSAPPAANQSCGVRRHRHHRPEVPSA